MGPLTLRDAAEDELPAALAVIQAAFEEHRTRLDPPSGVHRETVASLRAALGGGHVLLAELEGAIIGCVLYRAEADHMYLGRLAVLPAHRRRGVGQALIAEVEARARARGLPRVRLGVRVGLPELRDRYERAGYRVISEHRHTGYTEPTYLILEKSML